MKELQVQQEQQEQPPEISEVDLGYETPKDNKKNDDGPTSKRRLSNLPKKGLNSHFSMRIPANHDAHHTAEETHGRDHWKVNLLKFVHSDAVQRFLMFLLLADVLILFIELFLQATYPHCHIIERDAISCCPAAINGTVEHASETNELRFLAENGGHGDDGAHHTLCVEPAVESHDYEAACDTHKWGTVHTIEEVLFVCTITILTIFMVELLVMLVVLKKAFFRQFFYVLDLFIVGTSLALEIVFAVMHEDTLVALVGILIFGRVWRFVRIGHGLIEVTHEYANQDKEQLWDYAASLEKLLQDNGIGLPKKNERVRYIAKHISLHGSSS